MSVRHSPAPPILTITSWGPSTFGSSISSTVGRSLYWCSRSACIDESPRSWLDGGLAMTVRSFDTSRKRTSSQSFTLVGNREALRQDARGDNPAVEGTVQGNGVRLHYV